VGGEAFWAPNAVTYGYDSRQASVRIISPPSVAPEATRFEIRVPGADMNPYYTLGSIFLLGIRGIKKELQLKELPISLLTPEDKGKVRVSMLSVVALKPAQVNSERVCH
jgi:glutamine synthetase